MSNTLRQTLKPWAAKLGIESSKIFWEPMAMRQYEKKKKTDPSYRQWLEKNYSWIPDHWGTNKQEQTDDVDIAHRASQLFEITEMLRKRIGPLGERSVLDAGASDGMFLSLLGAKQGVGINFLPVCVAKIKSAGFQAVQCDIEQLPFPDKSFDVVICCEILEHVMNPIRTLNELARVCKGTIYLTIPWLERTRLNAKPAGWPDTESHIFEFNERDFEKVVTFSNVKIIHKDILQIFPRPWNPLVRWWVGYWLYTNFFPKLQYYELKPR